MKKRIAALLLSTVMAFSLTACGNSAKTEKADNKETKQTTEAVEDMSFDEMVDAAKGTTVTFYGWGGDDSLNDWLDNYYAPRLKEKYDITLERVPMDIDAILSQLSGEISTDKKDGDIDMIWINGENFKTCKENNMLYGPFAEELPNFQSYIDTDDEETNADFCFPIEGYEAPYGKAQLVTGSAFVRNVIYDICGYEQFMDMEADKETVKAAIEPALEYLRELNPYLWNEGKTFPKDSTALTNMYSDGEVVMDISYGAYSTATNIENGTYTETSQSFQFDKGTIGNTNYIAIAANSGNVAGAQVAINEMLDPEVQADRFTEIRTIPVVDYNKLNDTQKEAFDKVEIGKGVIPQDELLSKRLPEMPSALVPIIEEIWAEEVVGK